MPLADIIAAFDADVQHVRGTNSGWPDGGLEHAAVGVCLGTAQEQWHPALKALGGSLGPLVLLGELREA